MTPYYEESGITIYCADCRDVLPGLPRGSVDLIVTDPPYGVMWQSNARRISFDFIKGDEDQQAAIHATALALPLLQENRHLYLFGRYDLCSLPLAESAELIWDKGMIGLGDNGSPWGPQHEYIQFCVACNSAQKKRGTGRLTARIRRGSVLRSKRPSGVDIRHPSEKPVDILREMIESSSCFGETVLDYFAGIGSTLVAARLEGRRAIGIEIERRYCDIAIERLRQSVLPLEAAREPAAAQEAMFS